MNLINQRNSAFKKKILSIRVHKAETFRHLWQKISKSKLKHLFQWKNNQIVRNSEVKKDQENFQKRKQENGVL